MEAIKSGVVTKGMRVEIITAVAIQMMQHTMQPTSEVCEYANSNSVENMHSMYYFVMLFKMYMHTFFSM